MMIEIVGYQAGDPIRFSYVESTPTSPANEFLEPDEKPSGEVRSQVQNEADLEDAAAEVVGANADAANGDVAAQEATDQQKP